MLGVLATSFPTYPLTFTYAAEGEAPEGKADILDVTGPANFAGRLVVQRDTHLPVMLMWQVPATNVIVRTPGQPLPDPLPPGAVMVEAPAPPASTASQERVRPSGLGSKMAGWRIPKKNKNAAQNNQL